LPRNLDPDMGKKLLEYLEGHGLHIHFGKGIDKINGGENVDSVTIAGEDIPADIVVMAVGVVPQSKLAEEAGINVERGYVVVNDRMETSIKDIYALGDCTVSHSGVDGKPVTVALATTAFMQGSVAGVNAAGGDKVYDGSLGTFVSYIGEIEVSCTGYNSTTAERNGFNVITGRANMLTKPGWMPDAKNISVKLVADADSGRLLGGQAIGEEGASWRINIVALAVKQRMTVEDFVAIELAYCPAVSELFDPLVVAADILNRRYNRANKQ
jgi:NADH oxidase (H2O2-forming)